MSKKRIILLIIVLSVLGIYYMWSIIFNLNSEVTSAFQIMNQRLEEGSTITQRKLDSLSIQIDKTDYKDKVEELNIISEELNSYIEFLKGKLVASIEDPTDYSKMDSSSAGDELFFNENSYSKVGQEFVQKINNYKIRIKDLFQDDSPKIINHINSKFNERKDIDDWLEYNFKGFPLVASLTKLTQMQVDVKSLKENIMLEVLIITKE